VSGEVSLMTTMLQLLLECSDGLKIFRELFLIIMERNALLRQLTHHLGLRNSRDISCLAQRDLFSYKSIHGEMQLGTSGLESLLHGDRQWQGKSHAANSAMRRHVGKRAMLIAARD